MLKRPRPANPPFAKSHQDHGRDCSHVERGVADDWKQRRIRREMVDLACLAALVQVTRVHGSCVTRGDRRRTIIESRS